jgi:hypothetical protein
MRKPVYIEIQEFYKPIGTKFSGSWPSKTDSAAIKPKLAPQLAPELALYFFGVFDPIDLMPRKFAAPSCEGDTF